MLCKSMAKETEYKYFTVDKDFEIRTTIVFIVVPMDYIPCFNKKKKNH